jgi:hypothetical protein
LTSLGRPGPAAPPRRWRPLLASSLLVASLLVCQPTPAPTEGDGARDIMRRVLRDSRAEDEVISVTMQLIDATGRVRRRTATFYSKKRTAENSVRLIRFLTPPEFARSGILTVERSEGDADQWIYLPAYHASRRVPSTNRGDTWMGTDLTYEDITDAKIEQYQYRTVGNDRVNGVACTLIEAIPRERKLVEESAYSKTVSCVDVEQSVSVKIDYYDRAGKLFKILTNSGLLRLGKYRRWALSEMADLKRNHKTVLEFGERKLDRGLSDEYFDVNYLERKR